MEVWVTWVLFCGDYYQILYTGVQPLPFLPPSEVGELIKVL